MGGRKPSGETRIRRDTRRNRAVRRDWTESGSGGHVRGPVLDSVTEPHVRGPEWQAGFEIGRRQGVGEGKAAQTDAAIDVLRSALTMFELDDDLAEEIVAWVRTRLQPPK